MDQDAFRRTYREVNERFCAFEKSILTNQCECSQAERFCIAEREGVHCRSDAGQAQCLKVLEILRREARFALRSDPDQDRRTLPHGKAIRVQVGGLRGIRALLESGEMPEETPGEMPAETSGNKAGERPGDEARVIADIHALLNAARAQFGALERLPFSELMPHIAAYRGRSRSRRRRRPS